MVTYRTRKDWRHFFGYQLSRFSPAYPRMKKHLKAATARKSRRRKITDETPYKRLEDPWNYD
jgi:hypothetical protein